MPDQILANANGFVLNQDFDAGLHRGAFSEFTKEGIERIPQVYSRIFDVLPSSRAYEEIKHYSGLPPVQKVAHDLAPTPLLSPVIGPPVVFRHGEYRSAYKYTRVAAEDDEYNFVTQMAGELGESMQYTMETTIAGVLNGAQIAGEVGGWDNLPLGHASHKRLDGGNYSNLLTSGGPSYAVLAEIYNYGQRVRNDNGFVTPVRPLALVTTPELAPLWRQLLSSPTEIGQPNPGVKMPYDELSTVDVIANHYLTGTGVTFVLYEGHKLRVYMRKSPTTRTWMQDDPEAMVHAIGARWSQGWVDARRVAVIPGS